MSSVTTTPAVPIRRKLRIAWSVAWGIVAVLLCVFWVRSYWRHESIWIRLSTNRIMGITYVNGSAGAGIGSKVLPELAARRFIVAGGVTDPLDPKPSWLEFRYLWYSEGNMEFRTPFWFPFLLTAILTALPWYRWRFSLRTLLIVTTLVAVLLGIAMFFAPRPATAPRIDHVDLPVL